ncbi:MAG: BCCT family transporter [Hyphomicrobiaceae bacterium]
MSTPLERHGGADADADYETGHVVGQDNIEVFGLDIHNPVFIVSALTVIGFVAVTLLFQSEAKALLTALRPWLTSTFDWLFMLTGNLVVAVCALLVVSPWGRVRLGGPDARPDHSYTSWFAMLFSAGMGIGLMFFGVLEPFYHMTEPPLGVPADDAQAAARVAMAATIFHWGIHPWAIYAVVGLALGLFAYNHDLPLSIRSAFYPLIGRRVFGWPGHVIDTLAVFATLIGLATSLGFGASQAAAGLHDLFDVPQTLQTKVLLIVAITMVATMSVVAGLDAGIRRLSQLNMVLAIALLVFVIVAGPTLFILTSIPQATIDYLRYLPALSNWVDRPDTEFLHGWTTFYWAWWISWSPFVGMFIARVSRGRTVREFITAACLVPLAVTVVWMTAMGGTAIHQYLADGYQGVMQTMRDGTPELSLYRMLAPLPLGGVASAVGVVLVIVFFVTSSDSGSLVFDTITAGGKLEAPVAQRVFWAAFEGLVAIALLVGGGLAALRAAAISTGLPFALVLIAMCASLLVGLRREYHRSAGLRS